MNTTGQWSRAVLGVLGLLVILGPGATAQVVSPADTTVAFVNVNVVPMDSERVLADHTVVVRRDRIVAMGPSSTVRVPTGAVIVNGQGRYLMPGLSEMHGHTPVPGANPTSQFVQDMMFLYVANGVTTVRGMLGGDGQLELKGLANRGRIVGPTLYVAGPSFSGGSIGSAAHARDRVKLQKVEGWDLLKVHPGLTLQEYDVMARTAAEVGIRFGGHVPADVGLIHALAMGQETFDHIDGFIQYLDAADKPIDEGRLRDLVTMVKAANAWVVPTMVLWDRAIIGLGDPDELAQLPELRYWPQSQVGNWIRGQRQRSANRAPHAETWSRNRRIVLKALSDGGAGILMGTDSPQIFSVPGFSLHREMELMVESGMTPYQVLATGTKNVGQYFQRQDTFGTVAVGQRADLILTNANPLDAIANVADRAGVMVRGRWLSAAAIDERLEEIAGRN